MSKKKYKLIRVGLMSLDIPGEEMVKLFRLQALRDIPEHGVKVGDLGGFVNEKNTLSHEGSCWIGDEAKVVGFVTIDKNAYIYGNAKVINRWYDRVIEITDDTKIYDDAVVKIARVSDYIAPECGMAIRGDTEIYGSAHVESCGVLYSNTKIYGNANLLKARSVGGNIVISGSATLSRGVNISGKSYITDEVFVDENVTIHDCVISGKQRIAPNMSITGKTLSGEGIVDSMTTLGTSIVETMKPIEAPSQENKLKSSQASKIEAIYNETLAGIEAYETDIVKLIKYPVMTDRTDPYTRAMVKAVNSAKRLADNMDAPEFSEAVLELEDAYLAAESNALKLASTMLTEDDKKKTEKAKDLLAIASDEGASENEKKVSFTQAFKQLEGVLVVPEIAIDTFRVKIGLKELES